MFTHHADKFGHSRVSHRQSKSILTKASGFIKPYDYTLNPYAGCTFGCSYCYAAFFAQTEAAQSNWGYWVEVKANALELLKKKRKRPLTDKTIYMSSVTDPYQPIEKQLGLTRAILQELVDYHQPKLVIQTRGTLIERDIDLLKQLEFVQVNMTVTTDDEAVRKAFESLCPSTEKRLKTIQIVHEAGIAACVTMTPLLPLQAPDSFADKLVATGVQKFVVQDFHAGKVRFAAGTGEQAQQLAQSMQWDTGAYRIAVDVLRSKLPRLIEGQAGFVPEW